MKVFVLNMSKVNTASYSPLNDSHVTAFVIIAVSFYWNTSRLQQSSIKQNQIAASYVGSFWETPQRKTLGLPEYSKFAFLAKFIVSVVTLY